MNVWGWFADDTVPILVAVGAGFVAITKAFIPKAIDHALNRRMSDYTDANDRKMEVLRSELQHSQDRGFRSNEREYQAIMEVWDTFVDAYYATMTIVGGFKFTPNFSGMLETDFSEWLGASGLSEAYQKRLSRASNRREEYDKIQTEQHLDECQRALWVARTAVRKQSVFIPEDIEEKFEKAIACLTHVYAENFVLAGRSHQSDTPLTMKFISGQGEEVRIDLRNEVRKRVFRE